MPEEIAPPKRPRGRPRKHPVEPAPQSPGMAAEAPPKRPRGRPRKVPVPPALQPPAPKRPRGRPRKDATAAVAAPQPGSTPAAQSSSAAALLAARTHTAANLNRVRLRELRGALESELNELSAALPAILAELLDDFADRVESIRQALDRKASSIASPDEPTALMLTATLGKAAARLAEFRRIEEPGLDDLAKLARRLDKTARQLRRP